MNRIITPLKYTDENINVTFNLGGVMRFSEAISNAAVVVTVSSGDDPFPEFILSGTLSIEGKSVTQEFTGGISGVTYLAVCTILSTEDNVYTQSSYIAVMNPARLFSD